ncbi:hypothetical protein [Siminovitchia sp. 179-K 8D1 HS]|uniref:hypothetical protein n=1 Tax=Siminovitchia sp. 179-K 8D1 HS TaxID=3142385 RepID=UPI0039A11B50
MKEKDYINLINIILMLVLAFVATPFTIMFVWNVLVTYLVPVESIGYGGAFAVIFVRALFMKTGNMKEAMNKTPKESLMDTITSFVKLGTLALATLIVGYFIGAL